MITSTAALNLLIALIFSQLKVVQIAQYAFVWKYQQSQETTKRHWGLKRNEH